MRGSFTTAPGSLPCCWRRTVDYDFAEQFTPRPPKKPRDPDFVGAEAALRRAAKKARRRAFQTTGKVAVFIDGKVVWQRADGSFIDEPEGRPKSP